MAGEKHTPESVAEKVAKALLKAIPSSRRQQTHKRKKSTVTVPKEK